MRGNVSAGKLESNFHQNQHIGELIIFENLWADTSTGLEDATYNRAMRVQVPLGLPI